MFDFSSLYSKLSLENLEQKFFCTQTDHHLTNFYLAKVSLKKDGANFKAMCGGGTQFTENI